MKTQNGEYKPFVVNLSDNVKLEVNDDRRNPRLMVSFNMQDENKTQITGILSGKESLKPLHEALKYLFYESVDPLTDELRTEIKFLSEVKTTNETVLMVQDVLKKLVLAYDKKAKEPQMPASKD